MNRTKKWFGTITTLLMALAFFFPIIDSSVSIGIRLLCAVFGSFWAWVAYSTLKDWDASQNKQEASAEASPLTWKEKFSALMLFGIMCTFVAAIIAFIYWAYRTPLTASNFLPKTVLGWIVVYWLLRRLFKGESNRAVLPEQTEREMEEAAKAASVSLDEYKRWSSEYREWVRKYGHKPASSPKELNKKRKGRLDPYRKSN